MKRILMIILAFALFAASALADPLTLLDDYTADLSEPYSADDPSSGLFVFHCRYPHVDDSASGGAAINAFYEYDLDDTLNNLVPMLQDAFEGVDCSLSVSYEITCNNDDWFSVLVRTERKWADRLQVTWKGQVFSRKDDMSGNTCTLPMLLGILDPHEKEEWVQDYKTEEAENAVRQMVWDMIEENGGENDFEGLTEEYLAGIFFPAEDFFLDEHGNPVFFLQPGDIYTDVSEESGPLTFPVSLEDILFELY